MIAALLAWTITVSPASTPVELSAFAARFARNGMIAKGHCTGPLYFADGDGIQFCRTDRGHPYYCKRIVLSRFVGYELTACEQFNPI